MHIRLPKCHTLYTHHHKAGIVKAPNYTVKAQQVQNGSGSNKYIHCYKIYLGKFYNTF